MRLMTSAPRYLFGAALTIATTQVVEAATYDLPLDGTVSIVGTFPASYNPSSFGPIEIEVQAIENFSLPVFNMASPLTTAAVYQWTTAFSVLSENGSVIPEPVLSPLGTALTGYGQNCSVGPYCPHPSGESSETILSGDLFISADDPTLAISTTLFTSNIPAYDLELQVTLPDGLSITPLPGTWSLFVTGFGIIALFGWSRQRKARALS
jgi:hypothetical protein